jgi:glyoxylase-like metal-dependent hydrolase (beta-lactamase superfamily II)
VISFPWPKPLPFGGVVSVAPGVRWLRMPLPFRLDHINLWLLDDGDGVTVVDTGIGLVETRALWEQVLERELAGRPVTRAIVTHFHPDHMGNGHWLTERSGIDLSCTQAEWMIAQIAHRGEGEARLAHFRRNGVRGDALERLRQRGNHYPGVVPEVAPQFRALRDGDVLEIGGRAWHVMAVFGHSPEQAVLHAPEIGVFISGDQVLPKITTNVSVHSEQPWGNPLRLYLESLPRFRPLAADTLVLPSHNLPFRGLHARLDQLARHHDERLDRAARALEQPRTAADLIPVLFDRELDTHQLGFALGEALSHLHYLEWQARARRVVGADGVHRFVAG